ncbi:MAG: gliding motility-associated C-terminal domain-containing protein [Chitinophagaceae bacterium]
MKRLLIYCLIFFCLGSQKVLADTLFVTSTLPSGDGSLRDALQKAADNGNRTQDFIFFNITRARELVIKIPVNNPLPFLTSNLIIDGTTQPGPVLGVSQAKVCISIEGFYNGTNPLYLFNARETENIKIYGLYLKGTVVTSIGFRPDKLSAIYLQGSRNIEIGAPDKGNVLSGWTRAIYDEYDSRFKSSNVNIRSNFFGVDSDGVSITYGDRIGGSATNTYSIIFEKNSNNFTIGGSNDTYTNVFNSSATDIVVEGTDNSDQVTTISHNRFGIDYKGDNLPSITGAAINVSKINAFPNFPGIVANPVITDNYIGGRSRSVGIIATDLHSNFHVFNNTFGYEDRTGSPDRDANYGIAVQIKNSYQAKMKDNVIRYWKQGAIVMDATVSINISKNSTYCNKKRAIVQQNWSVYNPAQRPQPFIYVNRIEPLRNLVSGKSLPDNTIELFYNENCPTCEGRTYLATVQSDANGDWSYNGPLTGDNIIATASDIFQATSEYSMPEIDRRNAVINPVTCAGGYGSVCGLKILSGTKWRWEDETGAVVGYDTCLFLVPAGRYFLKISLGSSCEETFQFVIPDVSPSIDVNNVVITAARCGLDNGSVCGIRVRNGVRWTWEDETGITLSNNLCFNNARPGRYRLKLEGQQNCVVYSSVFEVPNKVPRVNAANAVVVHPSCGRNNGSITGIQLTDMEFATRAWYNDAGALISSAVNLSNAAPGRYKLVVKDNSGACGDSTAYFTLNIVPPPAMNISAVQVKDATCGNTNGSITGITLSDITGTARYWWVDQSGIIVANTADLTNVKPGSYRLKVRDGSNCDTLFSPVYTIADRGSVQLDSTLRVIAPTGCTKISGSITGIKITGATTLEWRNTITGQVVGNAADLVSMPAGSYQLTATNSTYGCTVKSFVYVIPQAPPMQVEVLADSIKHGTCGANNGSIKLTQLSSNLSWFTFKWLKDSTSTVGTGLSITDLSPATYYCIATDTNGCEIPFYKKTITALPLPVLNEANAAIAGDTCQFKTGRITGILATSDVAGLQYSWRTLANQQVSTAQQLMNVAAGDYYLLITDVRGCTVRSRNYNVPAVVAALPAPRYTPLINIARNSNVNINPLDTRSGNYELRDRITGALIAKNTSGNFVLQQVATDREVVVKYANGPCSSGETLIRIKVFDETQLTIPNAFSPNNDGINDEFRIQVIGYFRLNYLKIFNRFGQVMYDQRDLNLPWNGRRNGNPLPTGTYYWVIEGIDMHNKLVKRAGSITLIR